MKVDDDNNTVHINFTPTIPHCSMATLIGLAIRVKLLRSLPERFKVDVEITPGSHASEDAGNSCAQHIIQGAFHVVNREDLRREIELLLGVAAYSLLPLGGGATLFCFSRRKCWRDGTIYNYYK